MKKKGLTETEKERRDRREDKRREKKLREQRGGK